MPWFSRGSTSKRPLHMWVGHVHERFWRKTLECINATTIKRDRLAGHFKQLKCTYHDKEGLYAHLLVV
jgi:hypothetical protein